MGKKNKVTLGVGKKKKSPVEWEREKIAFRVREKIVLYHQEKKSPPEFQGKIKTVKNTNLTSLPLMILTSLTLKKITSLSNLNLTSLPLMILTSLTLKK